MATDVPKARYVPRAFDGARLGDLRARFVDVLERLGFEPRVRGTENEPKTRIRCPFHEERTPSLDVSRGLFNCFGCGASGDVFAFVGKLEGLSFVASVRRVAEILGVDPDSLIEGSKASLTFAPAALRAPLRSREEGSKGREPSLATNDLREIWDSCVSAGEDEDARAWFASRGLEGLAWKASDLELVRVIPKGSAFVRKLGWPSWDTRRLVSRAFDAKGDLVALRGRCIPVDGDPKSASNRGARAKGSVLACPLAALMLSGGTLTNAKDGGSTDREPVRLVVAEGEADFLTMALEALSDAPAKWATIGVPGSGFWTPEIADRIATGSLVSVREHSDEAGARLLRDVRATIGSRCTVFGRTKA